MSKFFMNLLRGEEGAGLVEYALLIVIISLAAVVGMGILGTGLDNIFSDLGTSVDNASVPSI